MPSNVITACRLWPGLASNAIPKTAKAVLVANRAARSARSACRTSSSGSKAASPRAGPSARRG